MPGYILEKLGKAKRHAECLYKGESDTEHPLGLEQEWRWFVGAIQSAEDRSKILTKQIYALNEIRECIEKGGEAVSSARYRGKNSERL